MAWIDTVRRVLPTDLLLGGDESAPLNGPIVDLEANINELALNSRGIKGTVTQTIALGAPIENSDARWGSSHVSARRWIQNDITDAGFLVWALPMMPLVGRVGALRLRVQGGAGHSILPATFPQFTLRKVGFVTETVTVAGTLIDNQANDAAEYETVRTIEYSGFAGGSQVIGGDSTDWYLTAQGETGANAQTGYKLIAAQLDFIPVG